MSECLSEWSDGASELARAYGLAFVRVCGVYCYSYAVVVVIVCVAYRYLRALVLVRWPCSDLAMCIRVYRCMTVLCACVRYASKEYTQITVNNRMN